MFHVILLQPNDFASVSFRSRWHRPIFFTSRARVCPDWRKKNKKKTAAALEYNYYIAAENRVSCEVEIVPADSGQLSKVVHVTNLLPRIRVPERTPRNFERRDFCAGLCARGQLVFPVQRVSVAAREASHIMNSSPQSVAYYIAASALHAQQWKWALIREYDFSRKSWLKFHLFNCARAAISITLICAACELNYHNRVFNARRNFN